MHVEVARSSDPELLETILRRDYFDPPLRHFSPAMLRTVARDWVPASPFVYFHVATIDGRYAGFVFGHTRGPELWREFARRYYRRHPAALALAWWRMRGLPRWFRRRWRHSEAASSAGRMQRLELAETGTPFQWSSPTGAVGYIDLVFVAPHERGRDCAPQLLRAATSAMEQDGVRVVEAHIDATNYPSMRAFQKAGWQLSRTADGDIYARFNTPRSTGSALA